METKKSDIKVYLRADRPSETLKTQDRCLYMWPTNSTWNDFTFRSTFSYRAYNVSGLPFIEGDILAVFIHIKIASEDSDSNEEPRDPHSFVRQVLSKDQRNSVELSDEFCLLTIHPNMKAYRALFKALGSERISWFLLSIGDLTAMAELRTTTPEALKFYNSDLFRLSFMRQAETFFAFHNAGSLLRGLDEESLAAISTTLDITFKLKAFTNYHRIQFAFSHRGLIPRRVCVVIGKNGVGKSRTLHMITKCLTTGSEELHNGNHERPSISRLIAISSPGETRNSFPRPRAGMRIPYFRINIQKPDSAPSNSSIGSVLVRLARSDESIAGNDRWAIFRKAMRAILPLDEIAIDTESDGQTTFIPISDLRPTGEQRSLKLWGDVQQSTRLKRCINKNSFPLSSGQITFVKFAANLCLFIENGSLVLIDEPETHLHPNYITDFMRLLDQLLTETGSFAILATHSAYFVREVARDQVTVLRVLEESVECLRPRLNTLGADVGDISHFVFANTSSGAAIEKIIKNLKERPNEAEADLLSVKGEMAPDAWMDISRLLREDSGE